MRGPILLVDDNKLTLSHTRELLEGAGYDVHQAESALYAVSLAKRNKGRYALAILDYLMPEIKGDEATRLLLSVDPELQIITFTGDDSDEAHKVNLAAGSLMVVEKGTSSERLLQIVHRHVQSYEDKIKIARPSNRALSDREQFIRRFGIIGASIHLEQTCDLLERYSKTLDNILIHGESGTGKERIAQAIHQFSKVANGPFITVNCASVNDGISESDLFGHVKGAFSGAIKARTGYFVEADGGTIFLDEIGDMPLNLQAKLLRVLQEREVIPVGAERPVKVNARVIAATNVDLEDAARKGRFREDLYFRLNVLPINLLPLRDRKEDISPLVMHFTDLWNQRHQMNSAFREATLARLVDDDWPGNVRDLQNIVNRHLARISPREIVEVSDLDDRFGPTQPSSDQEDLSKVYQNFKKKRDREERKFVEQALRLGGSIAAASKLLNMAKSTFYDRIRALGIKV